MLSARKIHAASLSKRPRRSDLLLWHPCGEPAETASPKRLTTLASSDLEARWRIELAAQLGQLLMRFGVVRKERVLALSVEVNVLLEDGIRPQARICLQPNQVLVNREASW